MTPKGAPEEWTTLRVSKTNKGKLEQAAEALQIGRIDPRTKEFTGPPVNDIIRVVSETILGARRKLGFS